MIQSTNTKSQMRKGILEYIVLLILKKRKAYPPEIIQFLKDFDFEVVEGTIYTLLNRLRKENKLEYEWVESTEGPPRKYFMLTEAGLEALQSLDNEWKSISKVIYSINETDL